MRQTILAAIAALILLPGATQAAGEPATKARQIADATLDLVVFRPLQVTTLALGALAFVPAALLTAGGGKDSFEQAWKHFAGNQVDATFRRDLGDF